MGYSSLNANPNLLSLSNVYIFQRYRFEVFTNFRFNLKESRSQVDSLLSSVVTKLLFFFLQARGFLSHDRWTNSVRNSHVVQLDCFEFYFVYIGV
ncbi:hypothetical protein K1719_026959 [Acacia pycnantha]|nr:hypothetical protein K1719_026959 [Acacia pycnantha]